MARLTSRAYSPALRLAIGAAGILTMTLIWEGAALALAGHHLLASPPEVVRAFITMLSEPFAGHTLLGHFAGSVGRFVAGFGLALLIGLPLGLVMGFLPVADALVAPLFNLLRYVAPIAWVPFAVLWFGTGFGGPVLIIFSGAFPACVVGAHGGAKLVNQTLVEAARTMGASNVRMLTEVILPSAMPAIISAIRLAAGNAWQSLVGAELIVASSGIAYIMMRGQMNRTITIVMVGMMTIGIVGLILETMLRSCEVAIERRFGRAPER